MIELIKNTLEQEFRSHKIEIRARVKEYSYQGNQVASYHIDLLYGDSRNFMRIMCNANCPYKPKVLPNAFIEPHKMINLCEIIMKAFQNIEEK